MASFTSGGVAVVAALPRAQHLSGTFDFGGPISTLPPTPDPLAAQAAAGTATGNTSSDGGFINPRREVADNNSQGSQDNPKATAAAAAPPPAPPVPAPPAPNNPGAPGTTGPGGLIGGLPAGVQNIGGSMVGKPGAGAPVANPATGGMTIPGTNLTQGQSTGSLNEQAKAGHGTVTGPGGITIYTPGTPPSVFDHTHDPTTGATIPAGGGQLDLAGKRPSDLEGIIGANGLRTNVDYNDPTNQQRPEYQAMLQWQAQQPKAPPLAPEDQGGATAQGAGALK